MSETLVRGRPGPFERPSRPPARKEWLEAQQENRCMRVKGNAMAPILADGASHRLLEVR